jgi:hypothetical protein
VAAGYRGQEDPGTWGGRLQVEVRDDPRGTTRLTAPVANAASAQLASLAGFTVGSVVRFVDGATTAYRRIMAVDPATRTIVWGNGAPIAALAAATTLVTGAEFRLTVRYQPTATADPVLVEEWPHLSMEADSADYVVGRLNHPFLGSRYVAVTDLSGGAPTGLENPAVGTQTLNPGTEGAATAADFVGDAAQKTGLFALDTVQVQLLALPDAHTLLPAGRDAVVRGAVDYCAARGDCTFVGAAPDRGLRAGVTVARSLSDYAQLESDYLNAMLSYGALFQGAKVYGALYGPWIRVLDPLGTGPTPARFVPPDGHVLGVYARTDRERGIWQAPAGNAAQIRGALDVAASFTDREHSDLVQNGPVNGIRRQGGAGMVVAASRTLSTDVRWRFVSTRLLFNFVKATLRDGLRFVRQEPHTEALRRTLRLNVVRPFLLGLWRQGAFGSDPPDQVFSIICDATNNPPSEVDLGNLRLEVYFYPVRPAEVVVVIIGQQASGASASEA